MSKNKPLILVVNDDGMFSPGIQFLSSVMREIGDVFVIAPTINRSGASHAMTLNQDVYIEKIEQNVNHFVCSGHPVDCVKIGVNKILPRLPDLCVSGINHGSNHSINALYSGTLHGAIEGTIQGIPSISFSHLSYSEKINLIPFKDIIQQISLKVLQNNIPRGITLNVNFPDIAFNKIKGIKICTQGDGIWKEDFKITKKENKKTHYLISGRFEYDKKNIHTDSWALENAFVSIVPIKTNCTAELEFNVLKYLEYDF